MPRGSRFKQKGFCLRPVPGTELGSSQPGGAGAFVGSTRSTRRIGSEFSGVRLETIGRILSIFSIWPRPRRSDARMLNTMSGPDRQAQRAENPPGRQGRGLPASSKCSRSRGFCVRARVTQAGFELADDGDRQKCGRPYEEQYGWRWLGHALSADSASATAVTRSRGILSCLGSDGILSSLGSDACCGGRVGSERVVIVHENGVAVEHSAEERVPVVESARVRFPVGDHPVHHGGFGEQVKVEHVVVIESIWVGIAKRHDVFVDAQIGFRAEFVAFPGVGSNRHRAPFGRRREEREGDQNCARKRSRQGASPHTMAGWMTGSHLEVAPAGS
jgi:hypothetical protein